MPPNSRGSAPPDRPLSFVKLPLPPSSPSTGNASPAGKAERKAACFEQVQHHFLQLQNQYSNLEADVRELEVAGSLWIKLTDRVEKLETSQKQAGGVNKGDGASDARLADLEAKIRQLEGRLEQQEGQQSQQEQHWEQQRCNGRRGPALEKQVQELEATLLRQQQQQQCVNAMRAMHLSALEKQMDELQTCVAQINASSTPNTPSTPNATGGATPTVSSTQLTLLKKQVVDLEDLLTQQQQAQRASQQEVHADLSSLGRQVRDLEQGQAQQQQQAKRSHDLVAAMEKQVKESMEQQQLANSSVQGYSRQIVALERQMKQWESMQQQALLQYSSTAVDNSSQLVSIERRLEEMGAGGDFRNRGSSRSNHSVLSREHRIGDVLKESGPSTESPSYISCTDMDLRDLKEVTRRLQSQQTILSKQHMEIASKCNPEVMDTIQDALSEAAQRLAAVERDQDVFKNTFVKASAVKELEIYLLERLNMQSEPMKKLLKTVDKLVEDAQCRGVEHNQAAARDSQAARGERSLPMAEVLRNYVTLDTLDATLDKFVTFSTLMKESEKARANNEVLLIALKELDSKCHQQAKDVYEKSRKNDNNLLTAMKDLDTKFEQGSDTQAKVMLRIAQQIDYVQNSMRKISEKIAECADNGGAGAVQHAQLPHFTSMAGALQSSGAVQELLASRHSVQAEESVVDRAIRNARDAEPPALETSLQENWMGQLGDGSVAATRATSNPLSRSQSGADGLRKLHFDHPDSPTQLHRQSNPGGTSRSAVQSKPGTGWNSPSKRESGSGAFAGHQESSSGLSNRYDKAFESDDDLPMLHARLSPPASDLAESTEGGWDGSSPLGRARSSLAGTLPSSQAPLTSSTERMNPTAGPSHRGAFLQRAHLRASSLSNNPKDNPKAPQKSPSLSQAVSQELHLVGPAACEPDSQVQSAPMNLVRSPEAHRSHLEPGFLKKSSQRKLQSTSVNSLG